jgi:ABC-type branched-subunit amino acid transport system substrate-binding protein
MPRPFCRRFAFIVAALAAAASAGPSCAAGDIVVGMSAAFTGPSRGLGIELYRGSTAWFDEWNAQNEKRGLPGRVVLKAYDDGYNPTPAIENTVQLIERDQAFLLFDYVGTPTVTRVLPLLKRHEDEKVFLFCPFTGAEPMRRPPYDAFVFNLRASYKDETAGLVKHFVQIHRRRIGVFYQIDAYGRGGWDGVREALAAYPDPDQPGQALRIVAEATYRRGAPFTDSMKTQVGILRAGDPDAVICIGAYAACAAFIRDARDAGWDVPIADVSFVGSENLLALLKRAGDDAGKDYSRELINSQVVPSPYRVDLPGVRLYRDLMDKNHPPPPEQAAKDYEPLPYSFVSLEGFLNARLLTELLDRLGPNPDRKNIVEKAESIKNFDLGIGAEVSFGPDRRQGMDHDSVYFTVADEGRFVRLPEDDWQKRWGR